MIANIVNYEISDVCRNKIIISILLIIIIILTSNFNETHILLQYITTINFNQVCRTLLALNMNSVVIKYMQCLRRSIL